MGWVYESPLEGRRSCQGPRHGGPSSPPSRSARPPSTSYWRAGASSPEDLTMNILKESPSPSLRGAFCRNPLPRRLASRKRRSIEGRPHSIEESTKGPSRSSLLCSRWPPPSTSCASGVRFYFSLSSSFSDPRRLSLSVHPFITALLKRTEAYRAVGDREGAGKDFRQQWLWGRGLRWPGACFGEAAL